MKREWRYTSAAFVLLLFASCDRVVELDEGELNPGNLAEVKVVFDIVNPGYWTWKDEVLLFSDGNAAFRRLEGEEMPASSRRLSAGELEYIKGLFRHFHRLRASYLDDRYKNYSRYSIILTYESGIKKTVVCDNSVYDHQTLDSLRYWVLRPIVRALSDLRTSLVGEVRFAEKLEFDLRPERTVVNLDEQIVLVYRVINKTAQDITLAFANQQQLGYKVYYKGRLIAFSPMIFQPAGSSWVIPTSSEGVKKSHWLQQIIHDEYEYGDKKVKSGIYTIVQYLLDGNSPYRSTDIAITEVGGEPLQARAIKSLVRPRELIYELNNRVSREFSFTFSLDRPVGYKITSLETGAVVRADSSGAPKTHRIAIPPLSDYLFSEPWNGRDSEGNFLRRGRYRLEMWLIGQQPDFRATREFWVF